MTDEMIAEEVARAIREARNEATGRTTPCPDHLSIIDARAAIKAYESALAKAGLGIRPREPTENMIHAGRYPISMSVTERWRTMWDNHPGKPDG